MSADQSTHTKLAQLEAGLASLFSKLDSFTKKQSETHGIIKAMAEANATAIKNAKVAVDKSAYLVAMAASVARAAEKDAETRLIAELAAKIAGLSSDACTYATATIAKSATAAAIARNRYRQESGFNSFNAHTDDVVGAAKASLIAAQTAKDARDWVTSFPNR